jgi:Mg-chelatase subunit ChlD
MYPWHLIITVLAGGALLVVLARFLWDRWRCFGQPLWVRLTAIGLLTVAVALLMLAGYDPRLLTQQHGAGAHLAVVLDVSQSVLRAEGNWDKIREHVSALIRGTVAGLPSAIRERSSGSIITVGRGALQVEKSLPLPHLPTRVKQLSQHDFPPGKATDLEAGLDMADKLMHQVAGRGAVVLATDGHQTQGNVLRAAHRLARQGIPIHVVPITSQVPGTGLYAADLPRHVEADTTTFVRGLLANRTRRDIRAAVQLAVNGSAVAAQPATTLPPAKWARLRKPLTFQGVGIQFVDLEFRRETDGQAQRQRFFTHVVAPPHILAIGGDNSWTRALPQETFRVTEAGPASLGNPFDPSMYDVVVISGVPATSFQEEQFIRLARAVDQQGTGLLLINGAHASSETTETMLMTYDKTPLEPLLPVTTRPRVFQPEPPPRHVVIVIDASGSMCGWQIAKAKDIARYIIEQLRPVDRLELLSFTTSAAHLITNQAMTPAGQTSAYTALRNMPCGGGTDPTEVLKLLAGRRLQECGLFFLSDGEFEAIKLRPDCQTTVFAIGQTSISMPRVLFQLAEPFPVSQSFDPRSIKISYFTPQPRTKYFEPGSYTPILGLDALQQWPEALPQPTPPLEGTAVTRAKDDAELIAVRPRVLDPVLACRQHGAGSVATWTTRLPTTWSGNEAGARAITGWITRLLAYAARHRYSFALQDEGEAIQLRLTLLAEDGRVPTVDRLGARLDIAGGESLPVPLKADTGTPYAFAGQLRPPRADQPRPATLVLTESGRDALKRPQRIPLLIPARGAVETAPTEEDWSYGLNVPLLREIARLSVGQYEPEVGAILLHAGTVRQDSLVLWPVLLVCAVALYLAQIWLTKVWI